MDATTVSPRQMLVSVPAVAGALSLPAAAGGNAPTEASADDPVFAAIERHREAAHATAAALEQAETLFALSRAEDEALLAWLTTRPTTMAGVLATLDYG